MLPLAHTYDSSLYQTRSKTQLYLRQVQERMKPINILFQLLHNLFFYLINVTHQLIMYILYKIFAPGLDLDWCNIEILF